MQQSPPLRFIWSIWPTAKRYHRWTGDEWPVPWSKAGKIKRSTFCGRYIGGEIAKQPPIEECLRPCPVCFNEVWARGNLGER